MSDTASEFLDINQDRNSKRFGERFKTVTAGSDTFHVYQSGDVELVVETESPAPDPVLATGQLASSVNPATATASQVAAAVPGPQSPATGLGGPAVAPGSLGAQMTAQDSAGVVADPLASNPLAAPAQAPPVSQVQPLTPPRGMAHENVTLGQLEPGLVWGIRQGLINPDSLAPHIIALLEDK